MISPLEATIQDIVEAIEITSGGQIVVKGALQMANYLFAPVSNDRNNQIKKKLSEQIYQKLYIQCSQNKDYDISEKTFVQLLKQANQSKNRILGGYKVLYADADGSIIVEKKTFRKRVQPGMYLRLQATGAAIKVGERVKLYTHGEFINSENAFYHVFGETPDYDFPEALVRFYFHLTPEGSPLLIRRLSKYFNAERLFFEFKCLKNPNDYTRADAGVLYVYKFDWNKFYPILCQIFEEISPYLKEETPLFTYQIAKGIAFGENPKDATHSFGTLRCDLIAEGMFDAYSQRILKSSWPQYILNHLEKREFTLRTFYLNPHSSFLYPF